MGLMPVRFPVVCRLVHLDVRVDDLAAKAGGDAAGGFFHLLKLSGEVGVGGGDSGNAEGGAVVGYRLVEFGHGDVEAVAEFVFERTDGLAAVLERLRVFDGELEGECGNGHFLVRKGSAG